MEGYSGFNKIQNKLSQYNKFFIKKGFTQWVKCKIFVRRHLRIFTDDISNMPEYQKMVSKL